MLIDFFILSLTAAGIAVIWRKLNNDFPRFHIGLEKLVGSRLICGLCFTFWVAFFLVLIFDPLASWKVAARFELPAPLASILHFCLSWFALGLVATTFRFLNVALHGISSHYYYFNKKYITPHKHD